MPESSLLRVLVIDDDEDDFVFIHDLLEDRKDGIYTYTVEWAETYDQGLDDLVTADHDAYLVDFQLGLRNGLELVRDAYSRGCRKPMILLTGLTDFEFGPQLIQGGASDFLSKQELSGERIERSISFAFERGQVLAKLRESAERYAMAIRGTNDGIWDWDLITGQVYYSPLWKNMMGRGEAEIGDSLEDWLGCVDPRDLDDLKAKLEDIVHGDAVNFQHEYRIQSQSGTGHTQWMLARGAVFRNECCESLRLTGTQTDVTSARLAQKRFEGLVECSSDGLIIVDGRGRIILVNSAIETIFGFEKEELIHEAIEMLIPPRFRDSHVGLRNSFIEEARSSVWLEVSGCTKQGEDVFVDIAVNPLLTDGETMFVASVHDATHRRRVEDELQKSVDMAQMASREKSALLANMSHELRTPLNAVLGFAEILMSRLQNDDESLEDLCTIQRAGEQLLTLVNGILDLSKLEANQLDLEQIECSPLQIVEDVLSVVRFTAQDKGFVLLRNCEASVPGHVISDPTRIIQVLTNLLSNAVKFTDIGSVTLSVRFTETEDGGSELEFRVEDTGIGIPADKLEIIFEPFVQADASMTRRYGGTGLGLSICRRLAEQMGGNVTVQSEEGVGSIFTFALRCELPVGVEQS